MKIEKRKNLKSVFFILFFLLFQDCFSQIDLITKIDTLDNGDILSYSYPSDKSSQWFQSSIYIGPTIQNDSTEENGNSLVYPEWFISNYDTLGYLTTLNYYRYTEQSSRLEKDYGIPFFATYDKINTNNGYADRIVYRTKSNNTYRNEIIILKFGNKLYTFYNQGTDEKADEKRFSEFIMGIKLKKMK